jgi:hypothetical protein
MHDAVLKQIQKLFPAIRFVLQVLQMRGQNVLAFRISAGTHIPMDPVIVAVTTTRRVRCGNAGTDPDGHADADSTGEHSSQ